MKSSEEIRDLAIVSLEDLKGLDIKLIDVRPITEIMDYMIIASGTSRRHAQSLAEKVVEDAKLAGIKPLGVEGQETGEWILIDLIDVVVHVMLPATRELYDLERLWERVPDRSGQAGE